MERSGSTPSQVPWYRKRRLTSVDNVDETAGKAAVVFGLSGAEGSFGRGPLAESLLPAPEAVGVG